MKRSIRVTSQAPVTASSVLEALTPEQWDRLRRRAGLLRSAGRGPLSKQVAERLAAELGVHWTTVYRWHTRFRDSRTVSSLAPRAVGFPKGTARLTADQERIIEMAVAALRRTAAPVRVVDVQAEVRRLCRAQRIGAPSRRSIDRRLQRMPQVQVRRRNAVPVARPLLAPGTFRVNRPLQVVQIDHTRADIMVVDELYRRPIGRPYLSVVMDVATRAVLAPVVTFDAPSAATVALCLARACAPKAQWIQSLGLTVDWPMQGQPVSLHLDNAPEFHSKALERGCVELGIELNFRPPGRPHFGGHIGRLIGTLMSKLSTLPGATGDSVRSRRNRSPEATATMTLNELVRWLVLEIGEQYHHAPHRGLSGATPFGTWQGDAPASLAPTVLNQMPFVFLPAEERRVRRDGVHFQNVRYWHPAFNAWAPRKKNLLVRYDPRDISHLYARGSKGEIITFTYADIRHPPISLWELKAAAAHLRDVSKLAVDETRLFAAIAEQRAIVQQSQRATRRARQATANRVNSSPTANHILASEPDDAVSAAVANDSIEKLKPYGGEIWTDE